MMCLSAEFPWSHGGSPVLIQGSDSVMILAHLLPSVPSANTEHVRERPLFSSRAHELRSTNYEDFSKNLSGTNRLCNICILPAACKELELQPCQWKKTEFSYCIDLH